MAGFGAVQPRQFILDSSRQNGATLGEFHQNNNRYLCTMELFDHSVPVSIPAGANISIKCKKTGSNTIYVLDKNNPDFASKVSFTPGENKIVVDRWAAMVSQDGQVLLSVDIDGMSTYTVAYMVDKDLMNGSEVLHHETPISSFAKEDLSNVSKESLLKLAKVAGLAENDLEDVDLQKLSEKVMASDIGKTINALNASVADMANPKTFDKELKSNAAFIALQNKHPSTSGMTPEQIKALFYANRYEEVDDVDLTKEPFSKSKVLYLAYQLTKSGQVVNQVLPQVSNDQVIMVEIIRPKGIVGGKVVFTPYLGDLVNGASAAKEISAEGYNGFWLPVKNETSYDWFGTESTDQFSLSVSDDKSNVSLGVKSISFENSTIEDDGEGAIKVVPDKKFSLPFF